MRIALPVLPEIDLRADFLFAAQMIEAHAGGVFRLDGVAAVVLLYERPKLCVGFVVLREDYLRAICRACFVHGKRESGLRGRYEPVPTIATRLDDPLLIWRVRRFVEGDGVANDLQNKVRRAYGHDLVGAPVFGEGGGGEDRKKEKKWLHANQ